MSDSETNGNIERSGPSGSTEDLSEYTDADESVSTPTEILAEFLSAIMLKDYETALKYCKLILHYEPNNSTAREFYPFIQEKIELMREQGESDDDSSSNYSESGPDVGSNHCLSSGEESESKETDSDATSASYSSLEDEEADRENNVIETGSTSLTSNDIVNGNAENPKIVSTSESETGRTEKPNGNEDRRKLGYTSCRTILSSDQVKSSPFIRKRTNNICLAMSNGRFLDEDVRNNAWSHNSKRAPLYSSRDEIDQTDDINHVIFRSDSESPTDPTVHELKRINKFASK